jgi:hypothetical protein
MRDAGGGEDAGRGEDAAMTGDDAGPGSDAGMDAGRTIVACVEPEGADPSGTDRLEDSLGTATVTVDGRTECLRSYTMTTTATLRDGEPDNPRSFAEEQGFPTLRSGHDLFDALHALALEEARENSVSTISDGAFSNGMAINCGGAAGCFETGRLWTYVWTRDTAFSVDLGLGAIDPARARGSLEFKLSLRRGGGDEQIVQDTGTGGSYPVSSDRVAWALAAWSLLSHLDGAERETFRDRAAAAIANTLEHDRRVVYDESDGLYFGETSFLDWREQSYPEWTADDVVHIAMSKSLSTNLLHLRALEIGAALAAETGDAAREAQFTTWAGELRTAIRARFWLNDEGLFSSYVTTTLDPAPVRRFDLLGSAFAVLFGVADATQAGRVLSSYPHYGPAAPVIFPEQQLTAIYHNRAEWPFVTAYWLRAAKVADNDAVADRMVHALVRGAALNLSNMENFESGTGRPYLEDGVYSGPVVNSQRQLWSVAGFLSMVHHTLFGLEAEPDGLHVRPYLTRGLRSDLFAGTDELVLNDYAWRGKRVTVVLHLPPSGAGGGSYAVDTITLNGAAITGDLLAFEMLGDDGNLVEVTLGDAGTAATLTERATTDWQDIFGPRTPRITSATAVGGRVQLELDLNGETAADVTWSIYRDGTLIAEDLAGTTASFSDPTSDTAAPRSPCYTAELTFTGSGNHSQHAPPVCFWGASNAHITSIAAGAMRVVGGSGSMAHGRFHYEPWGDAGHTATATFTAARSGLHLIQATFGNGAGSINTGITCAVKRVTVREMGMTTVVAEGVLVMPHLGDWARWEDSNFVRAELVAGRTYEIVISTDEDTVNMSAFSHFTRYTGGLGGMSGAFNRVNIAELKVFAM